ncbi:Subtilisin-like serine protease [Flavobacterium daejeonense]|nr:Subtilisin-like serine protease [Flavobacterium daejeonense]
MKKIALSFFVLIPLLVFSQQDAWVYFKSKANESYFCNNPLEMLSQRALDRRTRQNIVLDFKDIPINQDFVAIVNKVTDIKVMAKSKWMNAIHVRGSQTAINSLQQYDFVAQIDFADKSLNNSAKIVSEGNVVLNKTNKQKKEKSILATTAFATQIEMLNGQYLHQQNYKGSGKIIAVLDAGFLGVDSAPAFKRIRENNQILGGYNFVARDNSLYAHDTHGTNVLSTMAAYTENALIGTAIDASYYLFVTEDSASENPVEESLWVEAAEKADSLGVDIINTSLGYSDFDNPAYNLTYSERDGKTAFISKGAEIAFSRGMLVVVSAGNEGSTSEPHISAPADAFSVITVGAVHANQQKAAFSSIGPTSDGRIKPDVMALGQNIIVSDENGNPVYSNGTSFSAPIISGMLACLWQAYPDVSNQEIRDLVLQSSNLYASPNNNYGYGIPDFNWALNNGNDVRKQQFEYFVAYPNPTADLFSIHFPPNFNSATIWLFNALGQQIFEKKIKETESAFSVETLSNGIYFYKIQSELFSKEGKVIKN